MKPATTRQLIPTALLRGAARVLEVLSVLRTDNGRTVGRGGFIRHLIADYSLVCNSLMSRLSNPQIAVTTTPDGLLIACQKCVRCYASL